MACMTILISPHRIMQQDGLESTARLKPTTMHCPAQRCDASVHACWMAGRTALSAVAAGTPGRVARQVGLKVSGQQHADWGGAGAGERAGRALPLAVRPLQT